MKNLKKVLVLTILVQFFTLSIFAQSPPEAINYQAVARNLSGIPLVNQTISVQYAILQGSSSGTVVYSETHAETTNQFGLFTSEIGLGSINSGNFSTINWGSSIFYLQVTVDGDVMPATQLLSVPYALHAKTATSGVPGVDGHNSLISSVAEPAGVNCTNGGYFIQSWLDLNDDGLLSSGETPISYYICTGADGANGLDGNDGVGIDSTIHNADGTLTIYYSNSTTYTTNDLTGPAGLGGSIYFAGNGVSLSGDTITNLGDADADPNNEIQMLSLNATSDTIFLTNGGFVALPNASGDTDWIQGSGVIYNTTDFVGIGTTTPTSPLTIDNANSGDIEFVGSGNADIISNSQLNISSGNFATFLEAGQLGFFTASNERLTILNNGNVGVGNITPTSNLDVTGRTKTDSITISDGAVAGAVLTATDAFGNAEWQLPGATGDNWGTDSVNTVGSNILGNGTVANPLQVIDNDTSSTNEIELPATAILNQVLTWDGSAWVAQNSGAGADNWGSQAVVTDTTLSGDGTAGSPLSGFDGNYNSLSNLPVTPTNTSQLTNDSGFITNADDADADPNNELQVLSIVGDTIFLSNGGQVTLPSQTGDNWGTQTAVTDGTNITGDGTAGSPITLAASIPANTSDLTNDSGFITNADDADADPSNELQILSIVGDTLFLSNGNSVQLPSSPETNTTLVNNGDGTYTYTNELGVNTIINTNEIDLDADGWPAGMDFDDTNANYTFYGSDVNFNTINDVLTWNGSAWVAQAPGSGADNWGSQTAITDGTSITGDGTAGSPITLAATIPTNTSDLTNDSGFITNADDADADPNNELQVLSIVGDTIFLSNGGQVTLPPQTADNWGSQTAVTDGTNITGDGTAGSPITLVASIPANTSDLTNDSGFITSPNDADSDPTNEIELPATAGTNDVLTWNGSAWVAQPTSPSTDTDWDISAGVVSNISDNIGIGTASPSAKLEVTDDILVNSIIIGKGAGNLNGNLVVGEGAFVANTSGTNNTAIGRAALQQNADGGENVALGFVSLGSNTTGYGNVGLGRAALSKNVGGFHNVGVGDQVMLNNSSGFYNVAIGKTAMLTNTTGNRITTIGVNSDVAVGNLSNATAIGADAVVGASNSLVLGNNANVGIGTSTPSTKLDVIGGVKITDGTEGIGKVLTSDAAGNATWQTPAGSASPWTETAAEIYATDISKPIGIGLTTPNTQFKVHLQTTGEKGMYIDNAFNGTNSAYGLEVYNNNAFSGIRYGVYSQVNGGGSPSQSGYGGYFSSTVSNTGSTNYGIYARAVGGTTNYAGYFADGNVYIQNNLILPTGASNNYVLKSDAAGNASWADISSLSPASLWSGSAGAIYPASISDNVGIGTSAPNANLHVYGTSPTMFIQDSQTTSAAYPSLQLGNSDGIGNFVTQGEISIPGSGDYMQISATSFMVFNTNFSERMRINNSGDVGIGVNPTAKFHLNGSLRLDNLSGTAPAVGAVLTSIDALGNAEWQPLPSAPATFWSQTGNNIYPTTIANNVGIGTAAPASSSMLHVLGNANGSTVNVEDNGLTNGSLLYLSSTSPDGTASNSSHMIYINRSGANNTSHTSYGVRSNISSTGTTSTNIAGYFNAIGASTNWAGYFAGGDVYVQNNVGIGTLLPSQKLEVNGNVTADDYLYNVAQTRVWSANGSDFTKYNTGDTYEISRSFASYPTITYMSGGNPSTSGKLVAPLHLPDGATITSIEAKISDNDGITSFSTQLDLVLVTAAGGGVLASCVALDDGGIQTITTPTSISVDNTSASYALVFTANSDGGGFGNSACSLWYVRIKYEVTKAD